MSVLWCHLIPNIYWNYYTNYTFPPSIWCCLIFKSWVDNISSFCTRQISLTVSQLQPPLNERQRLDYEHTGCTWWSISPHACPSALTNCWNVLMWWHYRPAPPPPAPAPPSGLAAPDSTTNITTGTMYIHCKKKKGATHD